MRTARKRGTALVLVVVMSVVLTGLVMSLAWAAGVQSQTTGNLVKSTNAFYSAEGAAARAVWRFKHDQTWRAATGSPLTGTQTINGTTYNWSVTCQDAVGAANLSWKFDEGTGSTTMDGSGHGNTGTLHGGATWTTNSRSGKAISFNGVDGYVDCGNNASTNLTGDVSMAAWVKPMGAYYDQKIGANQNGTYGGYKLCVYNSKVEFEVRDAANTAWLNRNVAGGTMLTVGNWYHVVGVYSEAGHTIRTYVDGDLDRELTGLPANALASTTGTFIIGREPFDDTAYFWNGIIDDVRVFNRALTASEIQTLYDTTVDLVATATGGGCSSNVMVNCSVPTPPPASAPVMTVKGTMTMKNSKFSSDVAVNGALTGLSTGLASTITGNLNVGGTYTPNNKITVTKTMNARTVTIPTIHTDSSIYDTIQAQAGQTYTGNQTGTQFAFNTLGGNKVIYVNGNVTNPTFYIGGVYPSGGTLLVNGTITFSDGQGAVGSPGFPIYLITKQSITTGSGFNLVGAIYAETNWTRKDSTIAGMVCIKGTITDNSTNTSPQSVFDALSIPWFDSRATSGAAQSSTLPLYYSSFRGARP
jgi:Tfp pilus assembly protein PilX